MTREEAIKRLETHAQYFVPENDLDALYMAISALMEQEERSKGCKYCTATYIQHGSLVGFCPMCGRRLEEV
jgi:tRNA(Ile2) C34 agmatinyltransferase TiaS